MPEQYKRKPNTSCFLCKKLIYRRPIEMKRSKGVAYCSSKCYGIACRKEIPCVICGKAIVTSKNAKTCSRACSNKHRAKIQYKIGRPKDKAFGTRNLKLQLFKLRGPKCERCGYATVEILHVHHKDRDRKNNTLDNLEIICPNCHYLEHYFESSLVKNYIQGSVG